MAEDTKFTTAKVLSWIAGQKNKALQFLDGIKDDMSVVLASKNDLASVISFFADEKNNEGAQDARKALADAALEVRLKAYGNRVFFRGLIEFTNYCKNDCYYCGIGRSQHQVRRYRLSDEEILSCCRTGEKLGYHSFVLQGGEDPYYTDDRICAIIRMIHAAHPNTAITLSLGEKSHESYLKYFEAGANRYLLRHETATDEHYRLLHPEEMSLSNRKECLHDLMSIGYQVGAGFMVGSPYQTPENLAEDLVFLQGLVPHMVGIGPFIPSSGTRFADFPAGSLQQTLVMLALTRLLLPKVLLPSTTALGTIDPFGREKGFGYGANVVMPNLSPTSVRADYALYDNKICTGDDAVDCQKCLNGRILRSGNMPDYTRGDHRDFVPEDIQPSSIV